MGKLTTEQKEREYNRGQKAAREGRSRYWSEPSAYPFESDQHYEGRAGAFGQGYDDQFQRNLAEITRNLRKRTQGEEESNTATSILTDPTGHFATADSAGHVQHPEIGDVVNVLDVGKIALAK